MLVKALGVFALANAAMAICPGFNYGIGNVLKFPDGNSQWTVYDDSCNVVDGLFIGPDMNPCTQKIFGCSPAPIIFNRYTSTHTGLIYSCRRDAKSGVCHGDVISVCMAVVTFCDAASDLPNESSVSTGLNFLDNH